MNMGATSHITALWQLSLSRKNNECSVTLITYASASSQNLWADEGLGSS